MSVYSNLNMFFIVCFRSWQRRFISR